MMRIWVSAAAIVISTVTLAGQEPDQKTGKEPPWRAFLAAAGSDRRQSEAALEEIASRWRDAYAALIVDAARFLPSPRRPQESERELASPDVDDALEGSRLPGREADFPSAVRQPPGADIRQRLTSFLEKQTGKRFGDDLRTWRKWIWSLPPAPHADYAAFKAELYARIDPRYRLFFPSGVASTIRLDWGGVAVNGIPPLRYPKHIAAKEATWLRDGHIVFGVDVNGEARAYPKRILAWHELATDSLGSGRQLTFGTSGLLYRSNKLPRIA